MNSDLIIVLVSGAITLAGILMREKNNNLSSKGKVADAIIFKNNPGQHGGHIPVVRFLTDKKEWITKELDSVYSIPQVEGTKVRIRYDPDDPNTVEIDSAFRLQVVPAILTIGGMIGVIIGILKYLEVF
jgi:hypothetical protein